MLMKIIMFFDQIQSGFGTKDDKMVPLSGSKDLLGPSIILSPLLKEIDGKIVACIYCGNGTYLENPDEISIWLFVVLLLILKIIPKCVQGFVMI